MFKWLLKTPPAIGSKWAHPNDVDNPFRTLEVVVTDVRDGYVQYAFGYAGKDAYSGTHSCSVRDFRIMYRELKNG